MGPSMSGDMRRKTTDPEYRLMVLTWQYRTLDATPLEGLLNRGYEVVRRVLRGVAPVRDEEP